MQGPFQERRCVQFPSKRRARHAPKLTWRCDADVAPTPGTYTRPQGLSRPVNYPRRSLENDAKVAALVVLTSQPVRSAPALENSVQVQRLTAGSLPRSVEPDETRSTRRDPRPGRRDGVSPRGASPARAQRAKHASTGHGEGSGGTPLGWGILKLGSRPHFAAAASCAFFA